MREEGRIRALPRSAAGPVRSGWNGKEIAGVSRHFSQRTRCEPGTSRGSSPLLPFGQHAP